MSEKHHHTFTYESEAELIDQMEALLLKLKTFDPYETVRARYPHLKPTAFTQRLKRYWGTFRFRANGRGITHLQVTADLHRYLSEPRNPGARTDIKEHQHGHTHKH
jgi:hypothetical protein